MSAKVATPPKVSDPHRLVLMRAVIAVGGSKQSRKGIAGIAAASFQAHPPRPHLRSLCFAVSSATCDDAPAYSGALHCWFPSPFVPSKAGIQRAQASLAQTQPLSSPRRRGPITTKVSVIAGPATSPGCGVWVPACAGTTAESHCFTSPQ